MSVNIFGSSGSHGSTTTNTKYVDDKFSTLTTNLATKLNKSSDTMQGILNMGGNSISNVGEPVENQDAVTKQYADQKILNLYTLSTTGLVPYLTSPLDESGFLVSVSDSIENHGGYKVFNPTSKTQWKVTNDKEGITNSTNFWIKLECPFEVRVYKFCIKPTETTKLNKWKIQGKMDWFHLWEDLEFDIRPIDYTTTSVFTLDNLKLVKPYRLYRIFIEEAEGINPGLSYWQLYPMNPVLTM